MELKDISVIITGGASGLGEATARLFAASGAKVAILDMNVDKALQVAREINGLALNCDVTSEEESLLALDTIKNRHRYRKSAGSLCRYCICR
jgi:NAD(P)-dependent dehydrogenase (short-subunit alcohol dehydrogenase family)